MIREKQKVEIVRLYVEGLGTKEIGEKFGVTRQRVSQIIKEPQCRSLKERLVKNYEDAVMRDSFERITHAT